MFIIAGLGNPSRQYEGTRHNVGFDVIDRISDKYNISVDTKKHLALTGRGIIEGQKVVLIKPQTYMNLSGESIRSVVDFYKADPSHELIVIYDDVNLDTGQLRIREKGSAGGHNGLANITEMLGTQDYARLRIGIGNDFSRGGQIDFVLGELSPEETAEMPGICTRAIEGVKSYAALGVDRAMNIVNTRTK